MAVSSVDAIRPPPGQHLASSVKLTTTTSWPQSTRGIYENEILFYRSCAWLVVWWRLASANSIWHIYWFIFNIPSITQTEHNLAQSIGSACELALAPASSWVLVVVLQIECFGVRIAFSLSLPDGGRPLSNSCSRCLTIMFHRGGRHFIAGRCNLQTSRRLPSKHPT